MYRFQFCKKDLKNLYIFHHIYITVNNTLCCFGTLIYNISVFHEPVSMLSNRK